MKKLPDWNIEPKDKWFYGDHPEIQCINQECQSDMEWEWNGNERVYVCPDCKAYASIADLEDPGCTIQFLEVDYEVLEESCIEWFGSRYAYRSVQSICPAVNS